VSSATERLRGSVPIEIVCPNPESLLGSCARRGVAFRGIERLTPISFKASVSYRDMRRLRALSRDGDFDMTSYAVRGLPALFRTARRRPVLLTMLAVALISLWASSLFVWEIDVHGNVDVPERVILGALRELGFGCGAFGPAVASEVLAESMIQEIPQLRWFAVNISGSHADVLVRERVPKPCILDRRAPADVCASKGGLITKLSVLDGVAARSAGDTVAPGDVIVSGASGGRYVSADAEVWARTWYRLSAVRPELRAKTYTGAVKYVKYAVVAGKKINFSKNSRIPWAHYDKIITEKTLALPTGNILPVTFVTEKYSQYTLLPPKAPSPEDAKSEEEALQRALSDRLNRQLLPGGVVRAAKFDPSEKNGVRVMTLSAECLEQIAARRPLVGPAERRARDVAME
jgi:similar to stage IV sporulation protein